MSHIYKSSFKFSTETPFYTEDYRKAKHVISHIIENPESAEFRKPVNWQGLNLLDYPEIVKDPMDLGSIRSKLEEEVYLNIEEYLDDFELIWDNCKLYNIKGTWIYSLADKLEKNGKKMQKNYFPHIPIQTLKTLAFAAEPPKPSETKQKKVEPKSEVSDKQLFYEDEEEISLAEKMKLADKFKTFSPSQNRQLVEFIQTVCPTAFRTSQDKVQIVVDNMDIITFKTIMGIIEAIENGQEEGTLSKRVKLE